MSRQAFEEWARSKGAPWYYAFGPEEYSESAWIVWKAATNAALERAAEVCDEQANEPECPERASYCAEAIRALKEPQ